VATGATGSPAVRLAAFVLHVVSDFTPEHVSSPDLAALEGSAPLLWLLRSGFPSIFRSRPRTFRRWVFQASDLSFASSCIALSAGGGSRNLKLFNLRFRVVSESCIGGRWSDGYCRQESIKIRLSQFEFTLERGDIFAKDVQCDEIMGIPDPAKICTSHLERQNLTIRIQMRRFTRLTSGFSKKWENLRAAYCLHIAYYNLPIHKTLRVTPAMEARITDRVWDLADLLVFSA
jgi:hypothetical protein